MILTDQHNEVYMIRFIVSLALVLAPCVAQGLSLDGSGLSADGTRQIYLATEHIQTTPIGTSDIGFKWSKTRGSDRKWEVYSNTVTKYPVGLRSTVGMRRYDSDRESYSLGAGVGGNGLSAFAGTRFDYAANVRDTYATLTVAAVGKTKSGGHSATVTLLRSGDNWCVDYWVAKKYQLDRYYFAIKAESSRGRALQGFSFGVTLF